MSALTVKSIAKVLSAYVRPDEDIVEKLNIVMPRLYAMGMWRDLLFDWTIDTDNAYFALPENADGLLGAMLEDSPVDIQARWHDYRISGYANDGVAPIFGVVDDGWHPTKVDLPPLVDTIVGDKRVMRVEIPFPIAGVVNVPFVQESGGVYTYEIQNAGIYNRVLVEGPVSGGVWNIEISTSTTDYLWTTVPASWPDGVANTSDIGADPLVITALSAYQVTLKPVSPNTTLPPEGTIEIHYTDADGDMQVSVFELEGQASLSTAADVADVKMILFNDFHKPVSIVALDPSDSTEYEIARVRGDGVTSYRRFRFQNNSAVNRRIRLLLKRAWDPVFFQNDVIYLANLNAVKHAILGATAEDNADLERAQYHWTICRQILDEELDSVRGAAKPKLIINPAGVGHRIPNIL